MKYEIMFIVKPNLEEAATKEVAKKFEKVLTDNGAKVTSSKDLGQKELAYEIKKYRNKKSCPFLRTAFLCFKNEEEATKWQVNQTV